MQEYMKRVGLGDATHGFFAAFDKHLPANVKSVRLVRATTAADLQRMAIKANIGVNSRLDDAKIQQVLDALKTPPGQVVLDQSSPLAFLVSAKPHTTRFPAMVLRDYLWSQDYDPLRRLARTLTKWYR